MKIETMLWDTVEIRTTDKKKKKSWTARNATFNMDDRFVKIKEYHLGVHGESCQSLCFGSVVITKLTSYSLEATAEALTMKFGPKIRSSTRPVKIVATF